MHPPLSRLALFACLPAAAWAGAASAGTVTLLSQERSVSATLNLNALEDSQGQGIATGMLREVETAADFSPFDATVELIADETNFPGVSVSGAEAITAFATQSSSIEQRGNDVAFEISGRASVEGLSGFEVGFSDFAFETTFSVDSPTEFALTGSSQAVARPSFTFREVDGPSVLFLDSFSTNDPNAGGGNVFNFVFDGTGREFLTGELFPTTGILEPGEYLLATSGIGFDSGVDGPAFVDTENFGLILFDTTLATPDDTDDGPVASNPVAIPSPAALPAGLALLAGGLLRRRRVA